MLKNILGLFREGAYKTEDVIQGSAANLLAPDAKDLYNQRAFKLARSGVGKPPTRMRFNYVGLNYPGPYYLVWVEKNPADNSSLSSCIEFSYVEMLLSNRISSLRSQGAITSATRRIPVNQTEDEWHETLIDQVKDLKEIYEIRIQQSSGR